MGNPQTPINPGEEDVLEQLEAYFETVEEDEVVTREAAVTHLTSEGFERPDARDYIEQLVLKGYLYEVGDELRLLPRHR
ncbi:hypothetical protein ACFQE1_06175 [Halobium palmae]|uniref:Uncharacterized protein n=1 Tax=Halobium palmae TaxID=1776492 RepID=A0ABD5RXL4_9EURY